MWPDTSTRNASSSARTTRSGLRAGSPSACVALAAALLLGGCDGPSADDTPIAGRWYSVAQVNNGRELFQANCAACHGNRAQGTVPDWRQKLADGSYPPPPLDGSAHAWHHPMSALRYTVREGGIAMGGKMPPFGNTLGDAEQLAVIAYFQSLWTSEIYARWTARGGTSK